MSRGHRRGRATSRQQAESIKEAIYLTFTMLAVAIALISHGEVEPVDALWTLGVTALAMAVAVLAADVLAHLVVHDVLMDRAELSHATRASIGALVTFVGPAIILGLGVIEVLPPEASLWGVVLALSVTLVATAGLAVRGTRLRWWQRVVAVATIASLAMGVVMLELLAHG